jgi:hypothetical protein
LKDELNVDIASIAATGPAVILLFVEDSAKMPVDRQKPSGVVLTREPVIVRPLESQSFCISELTTSIASWGFKATGLVDGKLSQVPVVAKRLGVSILYVHVKEQFGKNESKLCEKCPTAVATVREVLQTDTLRFCAVAVSGGHIKGSNSQALATSHGLDASMFPAVSIVTGDGLRYAYGIERGTLSKGSVESFILAASAGELQASLKSLV